MKFVDEAVIWIRSGKGGDGATTMLRQKFKPLGGPDGGDGGRGGDVVVVADKRMGSLLDFKFRQHHKAEHGQDGMGKQMYGRKGKERLVRVPVGTIVADAETGELLADLSEDGAKLIAAKGGKGGRGNMHFKTATNQAPRRAEPGGDPVERRLKLTLKLLADVGLVGFPNAGKSTFISRVSAAKPKIADYPFTTLVPNLGVVRRGEQEMVVADIPGLIEGASEGRGLGHQFLRHVERARVLLLLVDLAAVDGRSPPEQQEVLLRELGNYRPDLLERPRMVVGTKNDVLGLVADEEQPAWAGTAISSITGQGIDQLVGRLLTMVADARASEPVSDGAYVVHRPAPEGIDLIHRHDGSFEVIGREAVRAIALSDLNDVDAQAFAQHRLQELGVYRSLAKAGAKVGDIVVIGAHEFEYEPD